MTISRYCLLLLISILLIGISISSSIASSYKFDDNDDLTLTVYFPYDELSATLTGDWTDFINEHAELWYDALEGQSRFKKVTIYNNQPEGLKKADIKILNDSSGDNSWGSAWSNGNTVSLSKYYQNHTNGSLVAHEFGHLIFGLGDEYVGKIDNAPIPSLSPAEEDTFTNYRRYGWTDDFLFDVNNTAVIQIDSTSNKLIFCEFSNGDSSVMYHNGTEHCTPASHATDRTINIQFDEYDWRNSAGTRTRDADEELTEYTSRTIQEERHGESSWSTIEAHSSTNFTTPGSVSEDTLPSDLRPKIVIIDGFGYAVCLDRSGSMSGDQMDMAKRAARIFIDLARGATDTLKGSHLSVTSFSSSASIDAAVREIVDTATRTELKNAVNTLNTGGSTAIGEGLDTSYSALRQMTLEENKGKAIILLSDGEQNSGINPLSVLPELKENDVTVYTIALGSGADKDLMDQIARETGGLSFYLTDAANLSNYFSDLFDHVSGSGKIFEKSGIINEGEQISAELTINQGSQNVKFSMISDNATTELRLKMPDGTFIYPHSGHANVAFRSEAGFNLYEISSPQAGTWEAIAYNIPSSGMWQNDENPDLPITDLSQTTSSIVINDIGTVNDLKVFVDIEHTWIGDLTIDLVSPSGTLVRLHDETGSSTDNILGTFGLDLVSSVDLRAFDGEYLDGTWSLIINDTVNADQGFFKAWSIYNTGSSQEAAQVNLRASDQNSNMSIAASLENSNVTFPEALHLKASVDANGPVSGAVVQATVYSPSGASWTIDLHDSGDSKDGDARAGDGEYSALFNNYAGNGTYEFEITVKSIDGFITTEGLPPTSAPVFTRTTSLQGTVTNAPAVREQITVKKLQYKLNENRNNKDTLSFQGSFNLDTNTIATLPGDVTFWMDDWFVTIPHDKWKQKGRFLRYKTKIAGVTAQLDFWKGGSSKCFFKLHGKKQHFSGLLPNYPNIPVGLALGDYFSESVTIQIDKRGKSYRMGSTPPTPLMFINNLNFISNKVKADKDKLLLTAKVMGVSAYDPAEDSINIEIGPFQFSIPAGTFTPNNKNRYRLKKYTYAFGRKLDIKFDAEKGLLNLKVDKLDQSIDMIPFSNPVVLNFQIQGQTEFSWGYLLYLNEKDSRKKTIFRY